MSEEKEKPVLARFRKDLKIYRGPNDVDGSPTYNVHDPVAGKYYKLTWRESLIFRCFKPGMTAEDLANDITKSYPVEVTEQDVQEFYVQAFQIGLLRVPQASDRMKMMKQSMTKSWWNWLMHHYLFIRVPIINPDRFLARTLHYVEPLGSIYALCIFAVIIVLGVSQLVVRFDQFGNTLNYFFNLRGVFFFMLAVSCVKVIHEFSHAYVAKHYKLYVPSMGVAFLVLWPVLYTDVTDGWKLAKRSQRFAISFAGIAAETTIAGFATLGWVMTGPGILQSVFFFLASTSWISTLLININPAVRFDGYYILGDLWGIDNLHSQAFAVARWKFHGWIFGLKEPPPMEHLTKRRTAGLVVFSIYVIIYRFFLYTAIALFVYFKFTKVLGIFLFLVEVIIFFIWPVWWEVTTLYQKRNQLSWNLRTKVSATLFGLAILWFILPLPHTMDFNGVLVFKDRQVVYAPAGGRVKQIYVSRGDQVEPGSKVIDMTSLPILKKIADSDYDKQLVEKQLFTLTLERENEQYLAQKQAELETAKETFATEVQRKGQLDLRSNLNGRVIDWDDRLREGQYVPEGAVMGILANPDIFQVIAFVDENDIQTFSVGQNARILVTNPFTYFKAQVESIHPVRSDILRYPALASLYKGPLAVGVKGEDKRLFLVKSYYTVTFNADPNSHKDYLRFGQQVTVRVRGPWRSYFWELVKFLMRVFTREVTF